MPLVWAISARFLMFFLYFSFFFVIWSDFEYDALFMVLSKVVAQTTFSSSAILVVLVLVLVLVVCGGGGGGGSWIMNHGSWIKDQVSSIKD